MSRTKRRENRRIRDLGIRAGIRKEKLNPVNCCGIKDPTPYEAVMNMIRKERTVRCSRRSPSSS